MKSIRERLVEIGKDIDRHIEEYFEHQNRELLAQRVVHVCRTLAEKVAMQLAINKSGLKEGDITGKSAIRYVKRTKQYSWVGMLYTWGNGTVGHDLVDGQNSYRLLMKWHRYLLRIKTVLHAEHSLEIFRNLKQLGDVLEEDSDLKKYYQATGLCIDRIDKASMDVDLSKGPRYYVHSSRIIKGNKGYYFQIQYVPATDKINPTERLIAFSDIDIQTRYAVRLHLVQRKINVLNNISMPITIITHYRVSIRPAEWSNLSRIVMEHPIRAGSSGGTEQDLISSYLTDYDCSLLDIIDRTEEDYNRLSKQIRTRKRKRGGSAEERVETEEPVIFRILDACRKVISTDKPGSNILRYLLYIMRNGITKKQLITKYNNSAQPLPDLSELRLVKGCISFDEMPFCTSPAGHNPRIADVFRCIKDKNRDHEHLARKIDGYSSSGEGLYLHKNKLLEHTQYDENEAKKLVAAFNGRVSKKHRRDRRVGIVGDHYYNLETQVDILHILNQLRRLSKSKFDKYAGVGDKFVNQLDCENVCLQKRKFLTSALRNSKVAAIYGPAGTGKTYLAELLAKMFKGKRIHFIAHTNLAVNSMRKRIGSTDNQHGFFTISKYLMQKRSLKPADILFIDECSMVSNEQMAQVLNYHSTMFEVLILMGDVMQLEAINAIGNWFKVLERSDIIDDKDRCILNTTYRTEDKNLKTLWQKVRLKDDDIVEFLSSCGYTDDLGESFFDHKPVPDSIVLCLNYGGLYGINNVNNYLQEWNNSAPITWYDQVYKPGDPLLFNSEAAKKLHPKIYNNCKGQIIDVEFTENSSSVGGQRIEFILVLDEISFTESDLEDFHHGCSLVLNHPANEGSTISYCTTNAETNSRDLEDIIDMPFNIAYAISIHKAQGLEFENVKVVIADEWQEQITHSVFYTAITRSKKNLKIYWTATTQNNVLERMQPQDVSQDFGVLSSLGVVKQR